MKRVLLAVALALLAVRSIRGDPNDAPPRAALITVGAANGAGETTITGAAGAVSPLATVICITLDTGHYAAVKASTEGSFAAPGLYAPAGTSVLIKVEPGGRPFDPTAQDLIGLAGTIVRVPEPPPSDGGVSFGGASQTGPSSVVWRFEGSLTYQAGQPIVVRGKVIIDSPAVDTAGLMRVVPRLDLERLTAADGSPALKAATFSSAILTPTGFPIERTPADYSPAPPVTFQKVAPGRAEAMIELSIQPPSYASDGYYRPLLYARFEGIPSETTPPRPMVNDLKSVDRASRKTGKTSVYAPVIRIGDPAAPRMSWMLLANQPSEGTRGTTAIEDRARFAFAPRVATQSDTLIIPRRDPISGALLRYRIEPFAPVISLGDRELPSSPSVPFRFPSGSLRAEIVHPDGHVTSTATLPFVQSRSINVVTRIGFALESGGGYPHDPYQLSTMDPSFEVTFEADGKYVVRLDGWIEDVWGNRWNGGGTFEFLVANSLVLDTAVLPGTPFERGNTLAAEVQVVPGVPADVEIRARLLADSDPMRQRELIARGRANRFGRFRLNGLPLDAQGEYRVDVLATWRDAAGNLWAGARTWGGVVAPPDAALVAHGERGIDDMPRPGPAWFRRTTPTGSGHIHVPFNGGDVLWATDQDAAIPQITYEDPGRVLAKLLTRFDGGAKQRYDEGATPPVLMTSNGAEPHIAPEKIDVWAYAYRSVQRPLVRVRELVGENSGIAGYYWRFNGGYGGQRGVGSNGDLPNDFKFQFGGLVVRGDAVGEPQYAIYGSLFVLVPDNDPHGGSRVFPPFRGNGGGTDGGPLFTLKGKDVDIFLHHTGVRAGTILERGDRASFVGYAAPTLPSKTEITVTSPSGQTRAVRGQTNRIGYLYEPDGDFAVTEAGVWKAKTQILFDGRTSAGQVTAPFPTGNVLGSRDGEFWFYVVERDASPLIVTATASTLGTTPGGARFVRPAEGPVTFTITPPAGMTNIELHTTTTKPGFILEENRTSALSYTYDAQKLAIAFPNLDLRDRDGRTGVDTITISFLLSGTDASGTRKHFARQIVLQGEELQMPDQNPLPPQPRRRAAR